MNHGKTSDDMNPAINHMAKRFRALGVREIGLEQLIEHATSAGYMDLWQMSREAINNAMKMQGLEVADGLVRVAETPDEHYEPVATDFAEFLAAAKRVMTDAEYPLDAAELIERTGIKQSAVPMATLKTYMRRIDIHFIPGAGYWRNPQYVDPAGRIISRRARSERTAALTAYFESHGWPIVGGDASTDTLGLVTSRFLANYRQNSGRDRIVSIGGGLYIPSDKADDACPLSPNVAAAILSLTPDAMLDDKDHLRLFRVGLWLRRHDYATLRMSRTTRSGIRRQTMRIELTDAGRSLLTPVTRQSRDAF